jgi:hypothetical protein
MDYIAEARCWDKHPSYAVEAVKRAEAKLNKALRELSDLEGTGETSAYRLGWALPTIESTLGNIRVGVRRDDRERWQRDS